jgi:voltage-gated potassium channel Kch
MPPKKPLFADSLSSFLSVVVELRNTWRGEDEADARRRRLKHFEPGQYWYRGVSKANYDLKPKVYRKSGFEAVRKYMRTTTDEEEVRRAFKSSAVQLMTEPHLPADEKGWYFLMQHYGAPTRLLDWTDGALLALYFSLRELKKPRDAAVWVLDPSWLNTKTLGGEEDTYLSGVMLPEWKETDPWFPTPFEETLHAEMPLALDPPHVARRVSVQRGHFTVHGTDKQGLDRLATQKDSRLLKIVIGKTGIVAMLDDLETLGIVETTIFPDLEGLSRELLRTWGGQ